MSELLNVKEPVIAFNWVARKGFLEEMKIKLRSEW